MSARLTPREVPAAKAQIDSEIVQWARRIRRLYLGICSTPDRDLLDNAKDYLDKLFADDHSEVDVGPAVGSSGGMPIEHIAHAFSEHSIVALKAVEIELARASEDIRKYEKWRKGATSLPNYAVLPYSTSLLARRADARAVHYAKINKLKNDLSAMETVDPWVDLHKSTQAAVDLLFSLRQEIALYFEKDEKFRNDRNRLLFAKWGFISAAIYFLILNAPEALANLRAAVFALLVGFCQVAALFQGAGFQCPVP